MTALNVATTWSAAHYAHRVCFPGGLPMVVATEPSPCADGRWSCQVYTHEGRREAVKEWPDTPMTLLDVPGNLTRDLPRHCEMGACPNQATGHVDACGRVWVCDTCRAQLDRMAANAKAGAE
ncbi:hypothetical protein [Microbispora sp. ATCC PTA-5024]|uniref:hypothetical protein n=1 Tax=Microbispora sp. ATCC PTA-5024 TaxID=316330 RepID=UPI0003DDD496|nr:hypothetical protein [Microbispora sp. ATCC PTA-5024]ETK36180.1 hypothetical protein MPTA5024_11175 [Microbispora sp. ATCC PTA-5024]